jgi:inhibitor of KinA
MNSLDDIVPFGERGWICTTAHGDDLVAAGLAANAVADRMRKTRGVVDAVAGVDSVVVRFDPDADTPEAVRLRFLDALHAATKGLASEPSKPIVIPVCYGGDFGPDLGELAAVAGLSKQQVTTIHSSAEYTVATVGFAPGFAYIGPLDERLSVPRLDTPRAHVPAGSVGLAGGFTCVYPLPSPGGWRIIGRTPKPLFQSSEKNPFVLQPGARVHFEPIDAEAFATIRDAR